MSHDNAKALCESMGAFMAEVPYGPHLNNWIVNKLIEKTRAIEEEDLDVSLPGNYKKPLSIVGYLW